jgi:hypothetical protein
MWAGLIWINSCERVMSLLVAQNARNFMTSRTKKDFAPCCWSDTTCFSALPICVLCLFVETGCNSWACLPQAAVRISDKHSQSRLKCFMVFLSTGKCPDGTSVTSLSLPIQFCPKSGSPSPNSSELWHSRHKKSPLFTPFRLVRGGVAV